MESVPQPIQRLSSSSVSCSSVSSQKSRKLSDLSTGDLLIQYAYRGKVQDLQTLLNAKVNVNYQNQSECTALHAAAAAGQLDVIQMLMSRKDIDPTLVDEANQTALHYAAYHGHLEVVQLLIELGVPLDIPDRFGRLVHNAAALNGHLDVVKYLLEECSKPININAIDEYGGTCLHWAALKGRKEVVSYLCRRGVDIYKTSYDNRTALQLAKDKHKHKCVQFLKAWVENCQQFLDAAEEGNVSELKKKITEINGAYPLRHLKDKDGKTALHCAASSGKLDAIKLLCEHFDVLTDVDKLGRNALHIAALGGHKDVGMYLVKKAGATLIRSLTLTNKSPSRCAFESGHSALAAKLQAVEEGHEEIYQEGNESSGSTDKQTHVDSGTESESITRVFVLRDASEVEKWLKKVEMDEYLLSFKKDGFDTLRGVVTVNEGDLIDMDIKKGHRRLMMSHIEDLQLQLKTLDEQCNSKGVNIDPFPTCEMLPALPKSSAYISSIIENTISAPSSGA